MKKKSDPISMKWYDDDEVTNNQDRKHLDIQERQGQTTLQLALCIM